MKNEPAKDSNGRELSVLILEGSEIDATSVSEALSAHGYEPTIKVARNEAETRLHLHQREWDLVISPKPLTDIEKKGALNLFESYSRASPSTHIASKISVLAAVDLMTLGARSHTAQANAETSILCCLDPQLENAARSCERDVVDQRFRDSQARYRGIFGNIPIGMFRCTQDSRLLDVNLLLAQAFGFQSREECISTYQRLSPESYNASTRRAATIDLAAQADSNAPFEAVFHRKDRSIMEAIVSVWPITDEESRTVCLEGSIQDVTLQREMERRLRELEQLHAAFTDHDESL